MSDSPYEAPEQEPKAPNPRSGLELVAALCVALGVLGLLAVCTGCMGLSSNAIMSLTGLDMTSTMTTDQADAYAEMMAATQRLLPLSLLVLLLNLGASALLLLGGGLTLAKSENGAKHLRTAAIVGLIADPLQFLIGLVTQVLMREQTAAYMGSSMSSPAMTPELEGIMSSVMVGTIVLTVLFSALWMVVKVVIYAVTLRAISKR